MPAVFGIPKNPNIPVSKLLIPLAFSSFLGGKMTLTGTPANILAQCILIARGVPSFGFFDVNPMGAIVLPTGIIYIVVVGRYLLPVRETADEPLTSSTLREYFSDVQITPDRPLIGKNFDESKLGADYDLRELSIMRDEETITTLHRDFFIDPNDHLILKGSAQNLLNAQEAWNLKNPFQRSLPDSKVSPKDFRKGIYPELVGVI